MHERFSDRARHAMALANQEATRLKHDYLAPAHVMLGLIAEGNCVATEALRVLNVDLDRVRDEVQSQMPKGDTAGSFGRAHTADLQHAIRRAIQEARKFGHRYVGTEHLILGLVAETESIPSKALKKQGLELDKLREKTLALLQSSVEASHDLAHSRHGDFEWVHQQELSKAFRSTKFWHTMILAVDSANRLGAGEVGPEHLLLALLRDPENGVSTMLEEKGLTADWLREQLQVTNGNTE
jgi:ATP-dependent Clp protease ATP-binding subunit ClpC